MIKCDKSTVLGRTSSVEDLMFKEHGQESKGEDGGVKQSRSDNGRKKIRQTTPAIQITQSDERALTGLKKSQKASWH